MSEEYRQALREAILSSAASSEIVSSMSEDKITYNASGSGWTARCLVSMDTPPLSPMKNWFVLISS